ncbi:MAG TPA: histidine kinase [Steroidobacteraceae bacterium]|nr:histidine kinase [Steroidobacteraceae bacterium]
MSAHPKTIAIGPPTPPAHEAGVSALPTLARTATVPLTQRSIWPVILWVTVPFWLLMTATRVSSYMVRVAAVPDVKIAEPFERTLQHMILFVVLILFYRLAFAIGWPEKRRALAALAHLALAFVFACLASPMLTLSIDIMNPQMHWLAEMLTSQGAIAEQIREWAHSGILTVSIPDFFLSYWFGLLLVLGARTYLDLRDHKLRLAQLEGETVRARLQALRMQLHPHFLFNTLHSVSGLIDSRPTVARQIIVRLGDLLRRSLRDGGSDLVPLGREVDFVRNYLEIQQLRFPDRLRFTINIEPAVQEAMVPGLILQPLAENAVVHGASEEDERVQVTIDARQVIDSTRLERWLELSVHNTGNAHSEGAGSGAHIGIGNTRERLRALYGERCSVELSEPPQGGFLARLHIPLREEDHA